MALAFGDTAQAERLLDEATSVLRETGPWFLNLPLYVRAILAVRRGDADAAIGFVRETVICSRQLHDRFAFVYALIPLAAAAALRGDDVWVARILGARDAITERTGTTVSDKSVRDLRDRAEEQARARLTAERWSRAYARDAAPRSTRCCTTSRAHCSDRRRSQRFHGSPQTARRRAQCTTQLGSAPAVFSSSCRRCNPLCTE